jgi:hypothetical protein
LSRVFSFRDLQLIPEISEYTELELLAPIRDGMVNKYLALLGFNIQAPILYVPAKHRDMQNKVGIGFRAVGEITQDREFLNSKLCSPIERLIAASYYDMSLTRELARMMGVGAEFRRDIDGEDEDYPDSEIEPDMLQVQAEILMLKNIRDSIRGTPYNEAGALKTPGEYQ